MRDDKEQSPLDLALKNAKLHQPIRSLVWKAGDYIYQEFVNIAYYLIVTCGCGGEEEKSILFCRACSHGMLDVMKKLVVLHKVDPKSEYYYYWNQSRWACPNLLWQLDVFYNPL